MDREITQEFIRSALDYDYKTGLFTWKADRPLEHFKNTHARNTYLSRFAGKVAGHVYKLENSTHLEYIQIRLFGKLMLGHRLACLYMYGFWPDGVIDHIDGNGLNNKMEIFV